MMDTEKITSFLWRWKLAVLLYLLTAILLAWGFLLEPRMLAVRHVDVTLPGWNPKLAGFRILAVSDLHIAPGDSTRLEQVAGRIMAEKPDMIFLLGDLVNAAGDTRSRRSLPVLERFLSRLSAPYGIFAVHGNHEMWFGRTQVGQILEKYGIQVLENRAVKVEIAGEPFYVAGLEDSLTGKPDVEKALAGIPEDGIVLMLEHNPSYLPQLPERVAMTFSGHTHGGQVVLPILGDKLLPDEMRSRYRPGFGEHDGRKLFLSAGVGSNPVGVRFNCPPEIGVVQLYAPQPGQVVPETVTK